MGEGSGDDLIAEEIRPVYEKDLYGETVTVKVRADTKGLKHGDHLRLRLEKINNGGDEGDSEGLKDTQDEI